MEFFSYDIARTRGTQNANYRDEILAVFVGESVIANYNKKIYKVDDIDFDTTPEGGFTRGNDKVKFHLVN